MKKLVLRDSRESNINVEIELHKISLLFIKTHNKTLRYAETHNKTLRYAETHNKTLRYAEMFNFRPLLNHTEDWALGSHPRDNCHVNL